MTSDTTPTDHPIHPDTLAHPYVAHPDVVKRLKRAQGHLKSILVMLEDGRDCLEVAQQLQAVEKAIINAKKTLIHDHIEHCLENTLREGIGNVDETIREFKEITKYF